MPHLSRTGSNHQPSPRLDTKHLSTPGANPTRTRAQLGKAIKRSRALKAFARYAYAPNRRASASLMHGEIDLYDRVAASQGRHAAETVVTEHLAYLTSF
jgi:hypothetical protein